MRINTLMLPQSDPLRLVQTRGERMEILLALALVAVILALAKYEHRRPGSSD